MSDEMKIGKHDLFRSMSTRCGECGKTKKDGVSLKACARCGSVKCMPHTIRTHTRLLLHADLPRRWTPNFGGNQAKGLRQAVGAGSELEFVHIDACKRDPRFIAVTTNSSKVSFPGFVRLPVAPGRTSRTM